MLRLICKNNNFKNVFFKKDYLKNINTTPSYNIWDLSSENNRLRYDFTDEIRPAISKKTQNYQFYHDFTPKVKEFNNMVAGTSYDGQDPIQVASTLLYEKDDQRSYAIASSVGSHLHFWEGLWPGGKGEPCKEFLEEMDIQFDGFDNLIKQMVAHAKALPTNGWTWLTGREGDYDIISTFNHQSPFGIRHVMPIFCIDCYEHAYIFDYLSDIDSYIKNCWKAANWDVINARFLSTVPSENLDATFHVRGAREFIRQIEEKEKAARTLRKAQLKQEIFSAYLNENNNNNDNNDNNNN